MPKFKVPPPNSYLLPPTIGTTRHDPTLRQAPGYSFGTRYSYHMRSGPGPYAIPDGMSNKGPNTRTGFSLHGRPKQSIWESATSSNPGPALFGDNNVNFRSMPSYSFGAPFKTNYKKAGPGPNAYNPLRPFGASAKGAIIGGRSKNGFATDYAKAPGPAAYGNPYDKQTVSQGPAYSIGRRTIRPKNKMETPGPNAYNPPIESKGLPNSPRFSMGVKHHEDALMLMNDNKTH